MRSSPLLLVLPLPAMLIAGCAGQGSFPSLAPRPIERGLDEEVAAQPAPVTAPDAKVVAVAVNLVAEARRGQTAFAARLPAAQTATAAAGTAGSESWVVAQQEMSRLEAARAPTVRALAELDRLAIVNAGTANLAAVTIALDQVRGIADEQLTQIGTLQERLSLL